MRGVEMSADRVDRSRIDATRLAKRDPSHRKSSLVRLRKIQIERYEGGGGIEMSADRVNRNRIDATRLAKRDKSHRKSSLARLRNIEVERYEGG